MDWTALNQHFRDTLEQWVNEFFQGEDTQTLPSHTSQEHKYQEDAYYDVLGHLELAADEGLLSFLYSDQGEDVIEVVRANDVPLTTFEQVCLAQRYEKLKTVRFMSLLSGEHHDETIYIWCVEVERPEDADRTASGQVDRQWATLEECRQAIDTLLRLNPAHRPEICDHTVGPSGEEYLQARLDKVQQDQLRQQPIGFGW